MDDLIYISEASDAAPSVKELIIDATGHEVKAEYVLMINAS